MSEWYNLDYASIEQETEKAFKIVTEDGDIVWVPKSQISPEDLRRNNYQVGDTDGSMAITQWLAQEKGLV